jgi:hypothetical protein
MALPFFAQRQDTPTPTPMANTAPSPRYSLQAAAVAYRLNQSELTQLEGWAAAYPDLLLDPERDNYFIGECLAIAVKHIRTEGWMNLNLKRRLAPKGFKPFD